VPIRYLGHVTTVLTDIPPVLDELVPELLLEVDASISRLREPVNRIHYEVKAIHIVQHCHVERSGNRALFFISPDMNVVVILTPVRQPMYQPGVAVKSEDYRLVRGEQVIEVLIAQAVRMLALRLQLHQVDDVDDSDS
jgi:hypothetical protein